MKSSKFQIVASLIVVVLPLAEPAMDSVNAALAKFPYLPSCSSPGYSSRQPTPQFNKGGCNSCWSTVEEMKTEASKVVNHGAVINAGISALHTSALK